MKLTRAEKIRQTRIANIIKKNPGMSLGEADQERIKLLKESGSRGGRATFEGKGFAGMSAEKRREAGRRGGLNRGKNK